MQLQPVFHFVKLNLPAIACGWLVCLLITAAPVSAQQYPGVKCVVDGNLQCKIQHSVKYAQGNVFFSSEAGVKHFNANVLEKLELGQQPDQSLILKANHQLALTNQVRQQLCPVTGKRIEKEHKLVIAGVKVFFHDSAAKAKIKSLESSWHRAQQVFAPDAFAKNFVRVKKSQEAPAIVADSSSNLPAKKDEREDSPTPY